MKGPLYESRRRLWLQLELFYVCYINNDCNSPHGTFLCPQHLLSLSLGDWIDLGLTSVWNRIQIVFFNLNLLSQAKWSQQNQFQQLRKPSKSLNSIKRNQKYIKSDWIWSKKYWHLFRSFNLLFLSFNRKKDDFDQI